jgi:hypothetical protein
MLCEEFTERQSSNELEIARLTALVQQQVRLEKPPVLFGRCACSVA